MMMLRNTNPLLLGAALLVTGTFGCVSERPFLEVNHEALVQNAVGSFDCDVCLAVVDSENGTRARRFNGGTNTFEHNPSHVLPCEVTRGLGHIMKNRGNTPWRFGSDRRRGSHRRDRVALAHGKW